MWVDEIIEPDQTRAWLSRGMEIASLNPELPVFNPGVLQT
jgi:acetyl-CoA carboxylase carboxyltransferase component